jgi:hypothetical protein
MHFTTAIATSVLAGSVAAKSCMNITVPVTISARTGTFGNSATIEGPLDPTTFALNMTRQGQNYTAAALTGYATTSGTYNISATYCVPHEKAASNITTLQVLTHGIGKLMSLSIFTFPALTILLQASTDHTGIFLTTATTTPTSTTPSPTTTQPSATTASPSANPATPQTQPPPATNSNPSSKSKLSANSPSCSATAPSPASTTRASTKSCTSATPSAAPNPTP